MNKWAILAIIAVLAGTAYWTYFAVHQFAIFHTYWDLGLYGYDFFYHIHYASSVWGLQYLSFGNHLAPAQLFILPFYALYQYPTTLLIIQALAVSLTAFLVYYIAAELTQSPKIGFVLCLAAILNPGINGIIVFDYHVEFLIIPAMLLMFYFYMKEKRLWFYVSLALLLGTMEFGPIMAFMLALALFVYELRMNRKLKKELLVVMLICLIAFGLYYIGENYLVQAYAQGQYPSLPNALRLWNQIYQGGQITGTSNGSIGLAALEYTLAGPSRNYGIYGVMLVLLSFGISALILVPDVFLILIFPWFAQAYILGYESFSRIWYHYYSFVMGGVIIATILSFMVAKQKGKSSGFYLKIIMVMLMVFLITYPVMVRSKNVDQLYSQFLLQRPADYQQIAQLKAVMALVPANASLLTNQYIAEYFTNRKDVGVIGGNVSFTPQYLLVDFNLNLSLNSEGGQQAAFNAMAGNYSLVARNGSAELWKLKVQQK